MTYSHPQARHDLESLAPLSPTRKAQLELHLAACPTCRAYHEEFLALDTALGELLTGNLPPVTYTPAENQAFSTEIQHAAHAFRPLFAIPEWLNSLAWGTALALLMAGMAWILSNTRLEEKPPVEQPPSLTLALNAPPGEALTLPGNGSPANQIAFSPDGTHLAAAYDDGHVTLYQTADQTIALTLDADPQGVNSLLYAPNGLLFTLGKNNGTLKVWQPADGTLIQTLSGLKGNPQRIGLSLTGGIQFLRQPNQLLLNTAPTVKIPWALTRGQTTTPIILPALAGEVTATTLSPDGIILATGSKSGSIYFWQITLENGQRVGVPLRALKGHTAPLTALAFHPSGDWLVSAASDGTVSVWRVDDGKRLYTLLNAGSTPLSLAFSSDGSALAASREDGMVYLWRAGE